MKKIFIGSSTNSVHIARDIQKILQKLGAETTLWTDVDAFRLSYNTLEELIHAARTHSGGVFIFNTDDEIISRGSAGSTQFIPRDNVVLCQEKARIKHAFLELGLPCQSFCFFV